MPETNAVKAGTDLTSRKEDKDWAARCLNALETAGDLSRVPGTTQEMKPLSYLDNLSNGKVDNPNAGCVVGSTPRKELERFHNRYTARFFADALRSWMLLLWLERTVTICAGSF